MLPADFSAETLQARWERHDIFKVLQTNTKTKQKQKTCSVGYTTQQNYHLEVEER